MTTNRDAAINGTMTDQQMEIEAAVDELRILLSEYVPTTTSHYAVEDLRLAIKRYYNSPVIRTKDVPDPRVDVSMRDGSGTLTPLKERNV
jgi:hypothetical protein